jgi:hypothetical protein
MKFTKLVSLGYDKLRRTKPFLPDFPFLMDVTACTVSRAKNLKVGEGYYHITFFFTPDHPVYKGSLDIYPQDLSLNLRPRKRNVFNRSKRLATEDKHCIESKNNMPHENAVPVYIPGAAIVEATEGCNLPLQYLCSSSRLVEGREGCDLALQNLCIPGAGW